MRLNNHTLSTFCQYLQKHGVWRLHDFLAAQMSSRQLMRKLTYCAPRLQCGALRYDQLVAHTSILPTKGNTYPSKYLLQLKCSNKERAGIFGF